MQKGKVSKSSQVEGHNWILGLLQVVAEHPRVARNDKIEESVRGWLKVQTEQRCPHDWMSLAKFLFSHME